MWNIYSKQTSKRGINQKQACFFRTMRSICWIDIHMQLRLQVRPEIEYESGSLEIQNLLQTGR